MMEQCTPELDLWQERLSYLKQFNDSLSRLNELIPWEEFRPTLEQIHQKERKSNAGRKPLDVILMFKLLVLQMLFNISDEQLEYQVNDRLSFMDFLGFTLADKVPDRTTVWMFRQRLTELGLVEVLFEQFEQYLCDNGYQAQGGQILDATLIPVPKQRNTKPENEKIKKGEPPEDWKEFKRRQKDIDARWTQKRGQNYFGYKNHINIDVEHGFIRQYEVTDASVHDSKVLGALLDEDNDGNGIWADSAYRSAAIVAVLTLMAYVVHINEKGYRNHPLTEEQKKANRQQSTTRAKVEHVFGSWVNEMGGKLIRAIGKPRVSGIIGLKNLAYNFRRYTFLQCQCA